MPLFFTHPAFTPRNRYLTGGGLAVLSAPN